MRFYWYQCLEQTIQGNNLSRGVDIPLNLHKNECDKSFATNYSKNINKFIVLILT